MPEPIGYGLFQRGEIIKTSSRDSGDFSMRPFIRGNSGVPVLEVKSDRVSVEILVDQGFQLWNLYVDGVQVGMDSIQKIPIRQRDNLLMGYGAAHVHCGPQVGHDKSGAGHPIHGVLHCAEYSNPTYHTGESPQGKYIQIKGQVSDSRITGWTATPSVTLYEGSGLITVGMEYKNTSDETIELGGYMSHANLRAVPGARISASIPENGFANLWLELENNPDLRQALELDPAHLAKNGLPQNSNREVVQGLKYLADEQGLAYSMEHLTDEGLAALCVVHKPEEFRSPATYEDSVLWLRIATIEEAIAGSFPPTASCGFLPTTTRPDGVIAAHERGDKIILDPTASRSWYVQMGGLNTGEAAAMEQNIEAILKR